MPEPLEFNPLEEDVAPALNVKINGTWYPVGGKARSVTMEMLSDVEHLAKDNPDDPDTVSKGLGIFFRVPATTFKDTDFRVLQSVLEWVQEHLMPEKKRVKGKKKTAEKVKNAKKAKKGKN